MYFKAVFALMTIIFGVLQTSGENTCQTCMKPNGAYCIDETSYYLCLDGKNPSLSTKRQCPEGKVCTGSKNICETISNENPKAVCSTSCGKCPKETEKNLYTCVSITQFGRCVNGEVEFIGQCEDGQICSSDLYAESGVICAPKCVTDFYGVSPTCDSDDIITTTTKLPPPVDTENIKKQCEENAEGKANPFRIRNTKDEECKSYIYCEKIEGNYAALIMYCKNGLYFNQNSQECEKEKKNCNLPPPTEEKNF